MLYVTRTNAIDHSVCLQEIFLAEHFLRLLAAGVSSQHLPGKTLGVFLRRAARNRIHLQQLATLICPGLFGVYSRSQAYDGAQHDLGTHSTYLQKKSELTRSSRGETNPRR